MLREKKEAILLLCSIAIAIAVHMIPVLLSSWIVERSISRHKAMFNLMMRDGSVDPEALRHLKTLINNYESLEDTSILKSTNVAELKEAVENLTPVHRKRFLKYSPKLNMAILGPLLAPSAMFSIKRIARG